MSFGLKSTYYYYRLTVLYIPNKDQGDKFVSTFFSLKFNVNSKLNKLGVACCNGYIIIVFMIDESSIFSS